MLKIALCDDDTILLEVLEKYFDKLNDSMLEYKVYFSGDELYEQVISRKVRYDVYILDIEMKGMSGLDLAGRLREQGSDSLIVFLTGYSKYVFDVFEIITFDFLLKPIEYSKFVNLIQRIKRYLGITKGIFAFSYRKNSFSIPCEEICYIEKSGRKAYLYTKKKEYMFNMTLKEIWEQLDSAVFATIHPSYIVNLAYVREIVRDELILKTGEKLFISKKYCQEIKKRHLRFIKEKMQ
uniref:LytR/AlgR family response regulator transcription factor n=1 Tax=Agathobacter sp. TaxID=2021311 RepID=UPI004055BE0B